LERIQPTNELQSQAALASPTKRLLTFVEAMGFAAFIGVYIWQLQFTNPGIWWLFLAWLLLSFILHRDTPKTLGWRGDNFWLATRRSAPVFVGFILALVAAGAAFGALHHPPIHLMPSRFYGYLSFCLLQQIALNSFLTNRFLAATENPYYAALLAGSVFAALHWPNPVLVPLTLVGGIAMAWLFATARNIIPLTLGQAILGALVSWAFPLSWHHFMRVGPGFYAFPH
jgi:hypothetical protein